MYGRLIGRSLVRNARAMAWSLATLTASGALATLFFAVSLDVKDAMSRSLRSAGANATARMRSDTNWDAARERIDTLGGDAVVLRLRAGTLDGAPVAVVSADTRGLERMTPYWAISGRRPRKPDECVVGRKLADAAKAAVGASIEVEFPDYGATEILRVTGVFESGDEDEARVFIPERQRAEMPGSLAYALLSIPGGDAGIATLQDALRAKGVAIEIAPLRQVLHGEHAVLGKMRLLAGVALLAVIVLTCLGVSAATLSRVMERRTELALFQALGATRRTIAAVLLSEGAVAGIAASALGFAIGSALSHAIVAHVFHSSVTPRVASFLAAAFVTVFVSVLAAAVGVHQALATDTAVLLKGE